MAKKKRGAPTKNCPECGKVVHARTAACPKCAHVYYTLGKKKVLMKKRSVRPSARPATASGSFSIGDIQATKRLVAQLGGTARIRQLLDVVG